MDRFKSNNIFFHVVGSGVVFINHISSHFYHYCILIHLDYVFMCERRFMLCSVSCFCCILCEDSEQECSKKTLQASYSEERLLRKICKYLFRSLIFIASG